MVTIKDELNRQNPWWAERSAIKMDEKIRTFEAGPIKWDIKAETRKGEIIVLRGPRQVGKTTLIKRKVEALISDKRVIPQSVCYLSCDMVPSKEHLYDYIREFLDFSALYKPKERWLFVDEISYVKDWPLAIKRLKDSSELKNVHLFLTGSNSVDLKRGAERLPGRGIEKNEQFIYPLPFNGYLKLFSKHIKPLASSPFDLFKNKKLKKKYYTSLLKLEPHLHSLNQMLFKFISTGGFLKPINELEQGKEPEKETYLRWIEHDISILGKDINYAKQVLRAIMEKRCSPASLSGIAKMTEVSSHNTIKGYLSLFDAMQVISLYGCFDRSRKSITLRKDKKIHFLDPFISGSIGSWVGANLPGSCVMEGVVAEHMRRLANQDGSTCGYYKDQNSEVDVMLEKTGVLLPIEIKWQEKIGPADFRGLYKFGHGLLISKNTLGLEKNRYLIIPAAMFLALFDIKPLQTLRYV